jgi:hypothetical protein
MASVGELALTLLDSRYQRASARGLVTTHADFGLDHWLLDDTGRVHALIDWTDSCIAPAEITLAALMWHAPELAAASADRYEALRGVALDRCLIFAIGYCGALGDVVELIEEGDDEDGVEWCLHFLRTWSDPAVMATLDVREE